METINFRGLEISYTWHPEEPAERGRMGGDYPGCPAHASIERVEIPLDASDSFYGEDDEEGLGVAFDVLRLAIQHKRPCTVRELHTAQHLRGLLIDAVSDGSFGEDLQDAIRDEREG